MLVRPAWAAPARDTSPRRPRRRADRRPPAGSRDRSSRRAGRGRWRRRAALRPARRPRPRGSCSGACAGASTRRTRSSASRRRSEISRTSRPAAVREEVLDRLRSLTAGADRADARAERDQRRLEVAPGRIRRGDGAHVAADGRLLTDLGVGAVARGGCERLVAVLERGERGRRPDRHLPVATRDAVQPCPREQQRLVAAAGGRKRGPASRSSRRRSPSRRRRRRRRRSPRRRRRGSGPRRRRAASLRSIPDSMPQVSSSSRRPPRHWTTDSSCPTWSPSGASRKAPKNVSVSRPSASSGAGQRSAIRAAA